MPRSIASNKEAKPRTNTANQAVLARGHGFSSRTPSAERAPNSGSPRATSVRIVVTRQFLPHSEFYQFWSQTRWASATVHFVDHPSVLWDHATAEWGKSNVEGMTVGQHEIVSRHRGS